MSKKNKAHKSSKKNQKFDQAENDIEINNSENEKTSNNKKQELILSPKKKRIFFVISIFLPIIIIGVLELGLRLFHFGPDLSLFVEKEIYGTTYYVMNPLVKARYFPQSSFAEEMTTDYFRVPKPQGTFRIFCLGGSTAAGFPYWRNASFASFLHQRLSRLFPERNIEVINLGMTAINSYTVLDIAKELPKYEPDLIIVYDGHNEFYGGLGVASNLTISSSRWVTLLYLQMIHSKVFLLIRETVNGLKSLISNSSEKSTRNLTLELLAKDKYIPYGSELYKEAENTFKQNLDDLCSICSNNHIPLILSTQVSNLRDMPPFVSIVSKELSVENKRILSQHMSVGMLAWDKKNWKEAIEEFRAVLKIDYQYALAHFKIADCLEMLGNSNEAYTEYLKARDYDQLRFRTSSDFNNLIEQHEDNTTTGVVDMEQIFRSQSPDSLIGNNIILEHVHPNSYGYFLMAKGYASVMSKRNIIVPFEEWTKHNSVSDDSLWIERPVTKLDEKVAARRTEILKSGQPFRKQYQQISAIAANDTLGQIAEHVVDGTWGWVNAHKVAAAYYLHKNDLDNLEHEYTAIVDLNHFDIDPQLNLAQFYYNQKRFIESEKVILNSLNIYPNIYAYRLLGDIAINKGNINEAIKFYKTAQSFESSKIEDVEISYQLATAYVQNEQLQLAENELLRVLSIDPSEIRSRLLLQKIRQNLNTH
ncbi:MAG: tetratricopeptide repeat protein [Ignavibacteriales bacterium]|nr:tetratricopeptide repeat protein [Ignavibacteriales bacterium]